MILFLPPFEDIDDNGNYIGKDSRFINNDKPQIVGYYHYYIKNNVLKKIFIPKNLKKHFMKKFGHDLLHAEEHKVNEFLRILNPCKN